MPRSLSSLQSVELFVVTDQFLRDLGLEHLEPGCVEMGARTPEDLKLCTEADFAERGIGGPIERRKLLACLKKI